MFGRKECKEMGEYYFFRGMKDSFLRLKIITKKEDLELLKMLDMDNDEISVRTLVGQPETTDIIKHTNDGTSRIRSLRNVETGKIYLHKLDDEGNMFLADISENYFVRKGLIYRELERNFLKRIVSLPKIYLDYCLLYPISKGVDDMCSGLLLNRL